ncbi:hypothetical protein LC605_05975 [Nostoc sp. CHAB 5836]|nr:hypothetical protein [Nostoc sp. CHAB 5836]
MTNDSLSQLALIAPTYLPETSRHSGSKKKMLLCPQSRLFCYSINPTASSTENKQINPRRAAY